MKLAIDYKTRAHIIIERETHIFHEQAKVSILQYIYSWDDCVGK